MKRLYADEAGCFTFNRNQNVSRYFLVCTVLVEDDSLADEVLSLRRELAESGIGQTDDQFHATSDSEAKREAMFALLAKKDLRVDATLLEKAKALPRLRPMETFYKHAWYYHLKGIGPDIVGSDKEIGLHYASVGTQKKKQTFLSALNDVAQQCLPGIKTHSTFWPSNTDPCLQVADYCAWAIQRAWERGDSRRLDQIKSKVRTQYDLFRSGTIFHY